LDKKKILIEDGSESDADYHPENPGISEKLDFLQSELKKPKFLQDTPGIVGYSTQVKNQITLEDIDSSHLEYLLKSKNARLEEILYFAVRRSKPTEATDNILYAILKKGSQDRDLQWMILLYFAEGVSTASSLYPKLVSFARQKFKKLRYTQWETGMALAYKGQYPELNTLLVDQLREKSRSTPCLALIVNNAEAIIGADWMSVLREVYNSTVDDVLKSKIDAKLSSRKTRVLNDLKLDLHEKKSRFMGALMGHAIGDALGNPVEIMRKKYMREHYGDIDDFIDIKTHTSKTGEYTDDTVLTHKLLDSIIHEKGFSPEAFMDSMAEWIRSYDRGDIQDRHFSKQTMHTFRRAVIGQDIEFTGNKVVSNGALIRVIPLVFAGMQDTVTLREYTDACTVLTHNSAVAKEGAYLTALALRKLLEGKLDAKILMEELIAEATEPSFINGFHEVTSLLEKREETLNTLAIDETAQKVLGTSSKAYHTLPYALYCFLSNNNFKDVIKAAVNIDGDSDSIAAIAGSFYGAAYGVESIPQEWIDRLSCKDKILAYFK